MTPTPFVLAAALALALLPAGIADRPSLAQDPASCDRPPAALAPLESSGLGLVRSELDALYGTGQAIQGGWAWEIDGATAYVDQCNIRFVFPDGWQEDREPGAERLLAAAMLPDGAVPVSSWRLGSMQTEAQFATLFESEALAARLAELGESGRSGSILVVLTYLNDGYDLGPIQCLELQPGTAPGRG